MKPSICLAAVLALPLFAACSNTNDDITTTTSYALGDALPGTNATDFAEAKAAFNTSENAVDGLGPIFNERGCGTCHQNGAIGGAGQQHREALRDTDQWGVRPARQHGRLAAPAVRSRRLQRRRPELQLGTDANPAPGATIFAGRLTTPVFGLGLVDSLPDSRFDTLASREAAGIRGIVNRVTIAMANPADPGQSQRRHARRPLRLEGRRSQPRSVLGRRLPERDGHHHHLVQPRRRQQDVRDRERANRAPTNAVINGCPDDAKPGVDDDLAAETNNCAGGLNELQDDVAEFTFFMTHLAPPPQLAVTAGSAADRGRTLFNSASLQCSGCHRDDADIFVSTSAGGVASGIRFHPFSDFLVHDMGTLGDGIGNAGDSVAVTRRMRTAPLWGLRSRNGKLHDGRTTDIATAISAHNAGANGQGTPAGQAFNALTTAQKSDLIAYLNTL